jgi:hypothetical protein
MTGKEGRKGKPIASEALLPILRALPPNWGGRELSLEEAERLPLRGNRVVAVAISGCVYGSVAFPLQMYEREVIAGITVLRQEPPESRKPREGEGNADHYIITESKRQAGDFVLYGPFHTHPEASQNAGIGMWHDYSEFQSFVDGLYTKDS